MFTALPFPWSFIVFAIVTLGWLFGRWRGRRVSLSGLAICLGAVLVGIPVAHFEHVDGVPLLILLPLGIGFGGAASFKNWIASAVVACVLTLLAILVGDIVVIAVGCSFGSPVCS